MKKNNIFLLLIAFGLLTYVFINRQNTQPVETAGKPLVIEKTATALSGKEAALSTENKPSASQQKDSAIDYSHLADFRPKTTPKNIADDKLSKKQKSLILANNKKRQKEISALAGEFNDNLSNLEKRQELKAQLKSRSAEYKETALSLAKDQLAREAPAY